MGRTPKYYPSVAFLPSVVSTTFSQEIGSALVGVGRGVSGNMGKMGKMGTMGTMRITIHKLPTIPTIPSIPRSQPS